MVAFSKTSPFSCYEVGHTWNPHCHSAAAGVGITCFEEGLKIYSSVYLLSALLSGKLPDVNQIKRICSSIVQSAFFLSCNGFSFISAFCLFRKLFGRFGILSSATIPSFFANLVAISIERPARRPALAVYVSNVASETIYNQLVARGLIKPVPYGDVVIFSLTLACLFRWYQTARDKNNFLFKLVRALAGEQELMKPNVPSPAISSTRKKILDARHKLCLHNQGCLKHFFQVLVKRFLYGWGLHACVSIVLSIPQIIRKPSNFLSLVKKEKHLRFGAFLASLVAINQAVRCALRWALGANSKSHSIIAGLLAGASVGLYRNTTLILYLAWKTLEVLYYEGIEAGYLMKIPGFASILYSLSTAVLFHAAVLEPHNLKPAYWGFLLRITGKTIAELNRAALDVIGTQSSKMLPNFKPSYKTEYVSDAFKSWLENQSKI